MKRAFLVFLCVMCLLVSLCACDNDKPDPSSDPSAESSAPVESGDPTDPDEPTDPTDPTDPENPEDPTKPTKPGEPTKPTAPTKPGETTASQGKTTGSSGTTAPTQSGATTKTTSQKTDPVKFTADKSVFNVVKQYGAKGNGTTDDTHAFIKAINAAAEVGGVVYAPAGLYKITSGLDVPIGVQLRGDHPTAGGNWRAVKDLGTSGTTQTDAAGSKWLTASQFSGTWILVSHDAGNVNGHGTIRLQGNASVAGFGFVYPDTAPVVTKVTPYPPAVEILNTKQTPYTRDGMTVEDIYLANAYIGVAFHGGNGKVLDHEVGNANPSIYSLGRMRVHNVTGSCLYRGMILKALLDTVDVQNVNFGFTSLEPTFVNYRVNNCADMEWYRADGTNVKDVTCYGAKYGIYSTPAYVNGSTSMRVLNTKLTAQYPFYITATGQYEVEGCTFTTIDFGGKCKDKDFCALMVQQDATSIHQPFYAFNHTTLKDAVQSNSATDQCLRIITKTASAPATLSFIDITFNGWSPDAKDPVVSYDQGGGNNGGALFYGCTFTGPANGLLCSAAKCKANSIQFNACTIPAKLVNNAGTQGDALLVQK